MTEDIFQMVKDQVSAREAAEKYGLTVNRSGFTPCPFHGEDTPSLKLYPGNRGFYCFGCHASGSVIDFTAQLLGLDALGAVRRLNDDFSLELSIDQRPTAEGRQAARHRAEIAATRQAFETWRHEMVNQINSCIRVANQTRPATWDDLTEQQISAIRWRETLEHYSDVLTGGSMAEQMEIFRDRRSIERICQTVLKNSLGKFSAA